MAKGRSKSPRGRRLPRGDVAHHFIPSDDMGIDVGMLEGMVEASLICIEPIELPLLF
jgi:hypothetical protein